MMKNHYANLPLRIKAVVIDSILLIFSMFVATELLGLFDNVPNYVRLVIAGFLFLFYDPVFTNVKGGTIGHMYANISVRRQTDETKNINFFNAIIRFLIKASFGWVSLLTTTSHEQRRAMHDLAAGSVVIDLSANEE